MNWRQCLNRIIQLNEEEIAMLERMISAAPNENLRRIFMRMCRDERDETQTLRNLLSQGDDCGHMGPIC